MKTLTIPEHPPFALRKNKLPPLTKRNLGSYKSLLFIRTSEAIHCIRKQEITFIKASSNYSEIFTSDGQKILASKTLKYFEGILAESNFARVHQSYLVNLFHLGKLNFKQGCEMIMRDQTNIPVSRSRQSQIISLLQN